MSVRSGQVFSGLVPRLNGGLRRVPEWVAYVLGVLPFLWIVWETVQGTIGIDPVKEIEHRLGKIALQLVVAGLCVTPLRRLTGVNLIRFRRPLGLLAFFYVVLHLTAWVWLDMGLLWRQALTDIAKRPYVTLGMAGFVLMVPLALTSTTGAIRRMGAQAWRRLHWLTYPAAVLGGLHYVWLVRTWRIEPFLYLAGILALLGLRAFWRSARTRRGGRIRGDSVADSTTAVKKH